MKYEPLRSNSSAAAHIYTVNSEKKTLLPVERYGKINKPRRLRNAGGHGRRFSCGKQEKMVVPEVGKRDQTAGDRV